MMSALSHCTTCLRLETVERVAQGPLAWHALWQAELPNLTTYKCLRREDTVVRKREASNKEQYKERSNWWLHTNRGAVRLRVVLQVNKRIE